jgi:hypothetical protein
MLLWHRRLWLIDHGATLYFHHAPDWASDTAKARDRFPMIRQHVLLRHAAALEAVDEVLTRLLEPAIVNPILDWIPDAWLTEREPHRVPDDLRAAYRRYLFERLCPPRPFVTEAIGAS